MFLGISCSSSNTLSTRNSHLKEDKTTNKREELKKKLEYTNKVFPIDSYLQVDKIALLALKYDIPPSKIYDILKLWKMISVLSYNQELDTKKMNDEGVVERSEQFLLDAKTIIAKMNVDNEKAGSLVIDWILMTNTDKHFENE